MLAAFRQQLESQLQLFKNHSQKQDFRQDFFKNTVLHFLDSKSFKRRKNAFYILNYQIQTDPYFAEVALKDFNKIKNILFSGEDLPNLTTIEMTQEYLNFKLFVNSKVLDWIERYSGKFPDLFIWKKSQSQFFQTLPNTAENQITSEKFQEKVKQLKIYKTIFLRNQKEVESMRAEFQKVRFESNEARKLMDLKGDKDYNESKEEVKANDALSNFRLEDYKLDVDMSSFVQEKDNLDEDGLLLFCEEDDNSTQMHNQESMTPFNQLGIANNTDKHQMIDIQQAIKDVNKFEASDKNLTLYRVIQDNKKTLERRFIPLLEMFKVECAFFKDLQNVCLQVVKEKKDFENDYKGKVKITKKEVQEFEQEYKQVQDEDILNLQKAVDLLLKSVCDLKKDLDLIRLAQDVGLQNGSNVVILDQDDDEDDPDEQLFK